MQDPQLLQDSEEIRADDGASDGDSALGSDDQSVLTESLRSTLLESRKEHGRGYHRYTSSVGSQYPLPEDEPEQLRLNVQHEMISRSLGGKLFISPISKDIREVLDLGTGTGAWALEMADEHPDATILGTDLSPMQPLYVPPNLKFEIDDFNQTWTFAKKFDFIHARALMGASTNFAAVVQQAFDHLTPDGYLEMTDVQMPFLSDDGTMEGTALETWSNRQVESCAKLGIDTRSPSKYKQMMIDAGFEDVQERTFKWPVGTWPKEKFYKDLGRMCVVNFLTGLEGFTLRRSSPCL